MRPLRVLLVGESWFSYSIHQKGFDAFQAAEYTEGAAEWIDGLRGRGHVVEYIPAHQVATAFDPQGTCLERQDVVVFSDVGSNTFLLTPDVFNASKTSPNRLESVREFVGVGGGFLMIGGYLSFSGIDGRARYWASPLAEVLPVRMKHEDDRVEVPQGFTPLVVAPDHPALRSVSGEWPHLLGYNRVEPKEGADVLVVHDADPILVVGRHGNGRAAAFTSDLAPHWAPPAFVSWEGYFELWVSLLTWLAEPKLGV